tara:strand:+ start:126 stop:1463 length:1338 start_codon:yes stop_codon:yes gene_type:complete
MSHKTTTVNSIYTITLPALNSIQVDLPYLDFAENKVAKGQENVRRPLDGMRVRPDTYATFSVKVGTRYSNIANTSSRSGVDIFTANMLIQSVNFQSNEKVQISQTFDQDRLFFFGSNLSTANVSAILIEDESFQWLHEFYQNYVVNFSGSSLADLGAELEFSFEDKTLVGYLTQFSFSRSQSDRHMAQVSFSITLTKTKFNRKLTDKTDISAPSDTGYLNLVNTALVNSAASLRSNIVSDPSQRLRDQLSFFLDIPGTVALGSTNFPKGKKDVSLRDAYPNEFINTPLGESKSLVEEYITNSKAYRYLQDQKRNIIEFEDDDPYFRFNVFDLPESQRDAILNKTVDEVWSAKKKNMKPVETGEDIYVKYAPATSTNTSSSALTRMGTGLAILGANAIISAVASEALNPAEEFDIKRAGKRIVDTVLGRSVGSAIFDVNPDEIVFR